MFIIGKYIKSSFKNRVSPCYFLSSSDQNIKNITKIEHTRLFLFTLLVSLLMTFLAQKLIYKINMWFKFVPGSFFGQENLAAGRPFYRKDFRWRKICGYGATFWKKQKLYVQKLTKERKQPPVVILQKSTFYNIFIRCLWLRIITRSDYGVYIFQRY